MYTIVTGAAGTLGKAVARKLKDRGLGVIALDMAPNEATYTMADHAFPGTDLTDAEAAQKVADAIKGKGLTVHGLINVAGGFVWETLPDGASETWETMWKLNTLTAVTASKTFLPFIEGTKGAIVNVGAGAAIKADAGMGAYTAAKSGVHRLTEALAAEVKAKGIRVNAVLPSIIDTPQNRADMPEADFANWVTAEEVANVICFLLLEDASGITGALIPVSGRV